MRAYGKKVWVFPDGYYPAKSERAKSHECVSVVNTGSEDAHIRITILFQEEREPMVFEAVCPAMKSNHVRLDKLIDCEGGTLPKETCYSSVIESDVPVVAQYSRMDTSCGGMALCTTAGYSE